VPLVSTLMSPQATKDPKRIHSAESLRNDMFPP
jgi:hypothetical protein